MDNSNIKLDAENIENLKRIEFKAFGDYETLWNLREIRGMLDDSAQAYSVLNRLSSTVMDISDKLEEDGCRKSRKKLEDLSFIIEFLMGDV